MRRVQLLKFSPASKQFDFQLCDKLALGVLIVRLLMENPSKLMVLSSSKGNNVANSHDRLIGLPEHIIHHIISFLGANDIARLSFASKGYRQICISSPYLYFDVDFASHECATKCSQFKEFLSKFLRSRNGQRIQLLRFRWLCDSYDLLPATLVSLEVLSLKSLRVYGALLEAWISTNCPSLKRHCPSLINLMISQCTLQLLHLNIPTSSLRKLSIFECSSQFPISIAVSAEQLQTLSLKLYGSWWKGSVFEIQPQKLICLQEAIVEFVDLQFFITDKDICNSVLRAVQYARVLQLSIQIIEVLSEDHVKILFENLLDLVMVCDKLEACQMIAMACFLMRAPNLRTLTIRYEQKSSGISESDVKEDLAKFLSLAVKKYQSKHGNSETLLLGDQLMKLKLSLHKN
ncbi:hypothetical protein NC651_037441 [Populus alba x Populus x berolinensis]|nr:hypothetical protein NC651_037441 [Populus alba x Populus x berolinensis]